VKYIIKGWKFIKNNPLLNGLKQEEFMPGDMYMEEVFIVPTYTSLRPAPDEFVSVQIGGIPVGLSLYTYRKLKVRFSISDKPPIEKTELKKQ
jgi:hypothetical protein